jgi:hypothetical protein
VFRVKLEFRESQEQKAFRVKRESKESKEKLEFRE